MKQLVLTFAVLVLSAFSLEAQQGAGRNTSIEITLPPPTFLAREAPSVATRNPLSKKDAEDLIRNGYPARLRYVAELWPAAGVVGKATATARWEDYLIYDPLQKIFQVARYSDRDGNQPLGSVADFAGAIAVLSRGYQPRIRAPIEPGRYYYSVRLEVERMTANDLEELRSWLGTTTRPQDNPGRSIIGFVTQIFTRLIGAEKELYKSQSAVFEVR